MIHDSSQTAGLTRCDAVAAAIQPAESCTCTCDATERTRQSPPTTNATVQLLAGETLDIRVLVDRPIVEIYVQQGRAAFVVSQPPNASSFSSDRRSSSVCRLCLNISSSLQLDMQSLLELFGATRPTYLSLSQQKAFYVSAHLI
jgi:hypothetical protein